MTTYEFCVAWALNHSTPSTRVLDYGCGAGEMVALLRQSGISAFGCDVFYEGGDYSERVPPDLRMHVRRMDDDRIPFDDGTFDLVISNQVFEHVPNMDFALSEVARVLAPGGVMLCLFPDRAVWREGHCGVPFLHRFPKGSTLRIYYAALAHLIGLGAYRDGKPRMKWAKDFCEWLDKWTYYRSLDEIHQSFGRRFGRLTHREELWFDAKVRGRYRMLPLAAKRFVVRRLAGMALVCREPRKI